MKTAAVLALAGAVMVGAQSVDGLSECAKTCVNNMLGTTLSIACGASDLVCRCQQANFTYGLRDCGIAACGNDDALNWGVQACASAGVPLANSPANTGSGSGNGGASAITTSDVPVTITSDGSTIETSTPTTIFTPVDASGTGAAAGDISTWTSVVTSGSVVQTLTGVTTLSAGSATTATSPLVSTVVSGSSTFVTTTGSSTFTTEAATSTEGGAASTSSSSAGAEKTAAPLLLAAAVAAVLL